MSLEEEIGLLMICEEKLWKLEESRNFFFLKLRGNQRNMRKVTFDEEVVVADGKEDEEEVEVMANNTNMEMNSGLETSPR